MFILNDDARCAGDGGQEPTSRCYSCGRRLQLALDAQDRWFPHFSTLPRPDGSCLYWLRPLPQDQP